MLDKFELDERNHGRSATESEETYLKEYVEQFKIQHSVILYAPYGETGTKLRK